MAVAKHMRMLFASLLALSPVSIATPVSARATSAVVTTKTSSVNSLLSLLENLFFKIADVNRKYGEGISTAADAADGIETLLKTFSDEPIVLDKKILEGVQKDTENLSKLDSVTPKLNLSTPEEDSIMQGHDLDAIRGVYKKIEERYSAYEGLYKRWQEKRSQAAEIADEANAAYLRGVQLEDALVDVLTNMPGNLLVVVYRFDYLWFDVATTLNPALAKRANEADRLRNAYDRSVAEMKASLDKAEPLMQGINFFQFQDALIKGNSSKPSAESDRSSLENDLEQDTPGLKDLQRGQDLAKAGSKIPIQSEETDKIQASLDKAKISNQLVRRYAEQLFSKANHQDKEAAEGSQIMALIQLGVSFAQTYAATPTSPRTGAENASFEYKYRSYEKVNNPDGSSRLRYLDVYLGHTKLNVSTQRGS